MSYVSVPEYYADKSVFVTGGTGFMGKVLVEKLLWSCPRLAAVYVLMREKRGKPANERLLEYLNDRVFERLQDNQNTLKKIKIVPGDVTLEELGISEIDREEIQRECHIVFHCAATVRFDMFLKDSVNINVMGTKKVLELAAGMKNLEAFVHVSTSFCHDNIDVLQEKMYPSRYAVDDIVQCMRWMDDEMVKKLEPEIIKPLPNTYGFTKCLSEDTLLEFQGKFPIAIARPSIVIAAVNEPMPGWVDNINGPTGMIYAAATGTLRIVYCKQDIRTEVIPVDWAINGCILLAYTTGLDKPKEVKVCNITQSGINAIPWVEAGDIWRSLISKYPLSLCLWYPNATPTSDRFMYNVMVFLTQLLPAYFLDMLLFLLGQKTFMLKAYHKIQHGAELLEYYMMRQWNFNNDYFRSLRNRISKEDNELFGTDMSKFDFIPHMENYVKGVREFYCKEDPSTLPKARSLHRKCDSHDAHFSRPKEISVCNITQSGINPITWGQALDMGRVHVQEFPFSVCLWYPGGSPKNSRIHHLIAAFFFHVLPAYFVDFLLFLLGQKTFMVKIQKRVNYGLEVLQYYTTKKWFFKNDYFRSLRHKVSAQDNEIFYTDIERVVWSEYIRNYIKGAREYCCKEDPATLPQSRRLLKQLYYLDKAVQIIIYSLCVYFVYHYIIKFFLVQP